ncbi:MAG: hypothetical protein HY722_09740 [Planctomycetes bacterium]|nr:hypothetical protein [Planctomycetota bacterium]
MDCLTSRVVLRALGLALALAGPVGAQEGFANPTGRVGPRRDAPARPEVQVRKLTPEEVARLEPERTREDVARMERDPFQLPLEMLTGLNVFDPRSLAYGKSVEEAVRKGLPLTVVSRGPGGAAAVLGGLEVVPGDVLEVGGVRVTILEVAETEVRCRFLGEPRTIQMAPYVKLKKDEEEQ